MNPAARNNNNKLQHFIAPYSQSALWRCALFLELLKYINSFRVPPQQPPVVHLPRELSPDHPRHHHRHDPVHERYRGVHDERGDLLLLPPAPDHPRLRLLHAQPSLLRQPRNDPAVRVRRDHLQHVRDRHVHLGLLAGMYCMCVCMCDVCVCVRVCVRTYVCMNFIFRR